MRTLIATIALATFAGFATPALAQADSRGAVKVVYHLSEGNAQSQNAIRNIRNHLTADPAAKIVVVTHAAGVQFLLDGAQDGGGAPFEAAVQELKAKGVDFRVCQFTLERNKIDPKKVIPEATLVPSGVAEVSRLQFKEGFAYLRP
ncbi:MAG TPA: DsrE family protein [Casimicrobiaceae bacterium]|nr:DsrE family protein [Casimicrobiaceae bacterium]